MAPWDDVKAASATLGFTARDNQAEGVIDGRRVSLSLDWTNRQTLVFVRGWLSPPLDLGLEVHRRQVTLAGENSVRTGSDDLDTEFSIDGDDPSRTGELFTPALREHLVALHRASHDIRLHDGGCSLSGSYVVGIDEAWIVRAAHTAAQTVAVLDGARAGLRAAAPLAGHADALAALASTRGLSFTSAPLSAAGQLDGRPIAIDSARAGRRHHQLTARAPFQTELGLGLAVRRAGLLDGLRTMLGGQDILVSDELFDRRFLVRADPAQAGRVPALLDTDVRATLLAVDGRAGPVALDDRRLTVEPIDMSVTPETLLWAIDALDEARARIEHNLLHGAGGGPYR